jgi:hypothetical protein
MPDYDPKSIPILDDIIEDDSDEAELIDANLGTPGLHSPASDIPELTEAVAVSSEFIDIDTGHDVEKDEDELNLFTDDSLTDEEETAGPALGVIDRYIDSTEDGFTSVDESEAAVVQVEYSIDQHLDLRLDQGAPVITADPDMQVLDDTVSPENTFAKAEQPSTGPAQTATLSAIVDDVVKQLMPDLEQQLRHLVQQALEEKLPEEISERFSDKKPD